MLISYTPDQQLLFDQDPAYWTEDTASGWCTHAQGGRIHIQEEGKGFAPVTYTVKNAHGALVASIAMMDPPEHLSLDSLLARLREIFSATDRRRHEAFIDYLGFLLLHDGAQGAHTVFLNGDAPPQIIDPGYERIIDLDLPASVQEDQTALMWIPARETILCDALVSSNMARMCIPLPTTAHGRIAELRRMQDTYLWARPPC